jgi:hypothetical protein
MGIDPGSSATDGIRMRDREGRIGNALRAGQSLDLGAIAYDEWS